MNIVTIADTHGFHTTTVIAANSKTIYTGRETPLLLSGNNNESSLNELPGI